MSNRKRFLLLGSISILLLAGLMVTFRSKVPIAHAACSQGCLDWPCPPGQSENSSSNNSSWVKVIQYTLNSFVANGPISGEHGFSFSSYPLAIDGIFGLKTESAVKAYQSAENIADTGGAVGNRTWTAMGLCTYDTHFSYVTRVPGATLSTESSCPPDQLKGGSNDPVFVTAIKDMLNTAYYRDGYQAGGSYSDTSPKVWNPYLGGSTYDSETAAAVEDYQAYTFISEDGIVGPQTWTQLYMCY